MQTSEYPIRYESGIPNPSTIPPAPDELHAFVRQYHRGLSRVSLKIFQGRKRYGQLNAIIVGAQYDEVPSASVDVIVRAVMAAAQEHFESVDTNCKFMVQCSVYNKPTGDPIRKAAHFELGGGVGDDPYSESIQSPEHMDDMLFTHIRECHREILDQAKIISEIGREAIKNAGEVFRFKQEALDAQASANAVVLDMRRDEAAERGRQQKWDRGFKLLENAVNTGIAQALVSQATGGQLKLPVPAGAAQVPGSVVAPVATTPRPSWATASLIAPPVVQEVKAADPTPAPVEIETETDMDAAQKGSKLFHSITAEQWPELFDRLSKAQVNLLRELKDANDSAVVLTAVAKFRASLKEPQLVSLAQILTVEQLAVVIGLAGEAE